MLSGAAQMLSHTVALQALQDFANLEVEEVEAPASPRHIASCLGEGVATTAYHLM